MVCNPGPGGAGREQPLEDRPRMDQIEDVPFQNGNERLR